MSEQRRAVGQKTHAESIYICSTCAHVEVSDNDQQHCGKLMDNAGWFESIALGKNTK